MSDPLPIALELCYDGKNFAGSAFQLKKPTVCRCILDALKLSKLFVNDKIVFAGRTDKKVSAMGMVITLLIKSSFRDDDTNPDTNINYDAILNRYLPKSIRITGWTIVPLDFSARFNCTLRKYKYFFYKNNLNIKLMEEACEIIKSATHFKNLSKKPTKFQDEKYFYRPLKTISISNFCDEIFVLNISSISFIHNMIRKIFWSLKMVGLNKMSLEELEKITKNEEEIQTGTEIGEALLFCGAEFDRKLEWRRGKCKEKDVIGSVVNCEISKWIYENGKKDGD